MLDTSTPGGWSSRFKRQLILFSMIAVSPALQLVRHFSTIPNTVLLFVWLPALAYVAFAVVYVVRYWPKRSEPPMSRRESLILGTFLTVVVVVIGVNEYFVFSAAPAHNAHYAPVH